ncbi:MAG: hypothetical protein ACYTF9_00010 [Planctomycetota bacterium]|jgi:hypothetical protein
MSDDRNKPDKTIARSLGEFLGHIVKGIKTDPARKVVRQSTEERTSDDGRMILRRTTIEEIEVRKGDLPSASDDNETRDDDHARD